MIKKQKRQRIVRNVHTAGMLDKAASTRSGMDGMAEHNRRTQMRLRSAQHCMVVSRLPESSEALLVACRHTNTKLRTKMRTHTHAYHTRI